jgi:hypothetical protein
VAHEEGSTELSGQGVDLGLFSIGKFGSGSGSQSTQLIALGSNEAQYYNYPAGGMPTELITNGLDRPLGVTGSRARIAAPRSIRNHAAPSLLKAF